MEAPSRTSGNPDANVTRTIVGMSPSRTVHDRLILDPSCPLDTALAVIGGRWKGSILRWVAQEPRRPAELGRLIPNAPERVILRQLAELVEDGVLERRAGASPAAGTVYALSPRGRELGPALAALCAWGGEELARRGGGGDDDSPPTERAG